MTDLSPNLQSIYDDIAKGELSEAVRLAELIKSGGAKETEKELSMLYDLFPTVVDHMLDLADMCRRREEMWASSEVPVQA